MPSMSENEVLLQTYIFQFTGEFITYILCQYAEKNMQLVLMKKIKIRKTGKKKIVLMTLNE